MFPLQVTCVVGVTGNLLGGRRDAVTEDSGLPQRQGLSLPLPGDQPGLGAGVGSPEPPWPAWVPLGAGPGHEEGWPGRAPGCHVLRVTWRLLAAPDVR